MEFRIWGIESKSGFSIVEVLLSGSIFLLLLSAILGAVIYGGEGSAASGERVRAIYLAEEGLEAVRNIKDAGFSNLPDGTFGLTTSTNIWSLSGSSNAIETFNRQIQISSMDTNKKHVTSTVTWQQSATRTGRVSLATRFTNWARSAGVWLTPNKIASINFTGNQDGSKIAVQGNYAYIVRADGSPDFAVVDISNPALPTILGTLSLAGIPQNIAVSGSFAYISNETNTQELQIINIANPKAPVVAGTYNAPGTANGTGVFVSGTTAYLLRITSTDNEFLIINASSPSSPFLVGSLNLGDTGREVWVSGSYAYVAGANNTQELQVINITNPALPVFQGILNLSGTNDAFTITGFGATLLLGHNTFLDIINVSTPASPSLLGSINLGGRVNDLALYNIDNSLVFAGTSNGTMEFQVIDITNPASPALQSSLNLFDNANGVAYEDVQDRIYIADAANAEELIVIAPQ